MSEDNIDTVSSDSSDAYTEQVKPDEGKYKVMIIIISVVLMVIFVGGYFVLQHFAKDEVAPKSTLNFNQKLSDSESLGKLTKNVTPEYKKMIDELNDKNFQNSQASGESSIPVLVGNPLQVTELEADERIRRVRDKIKEDKLQSVNVAPVVAQKRSNDEENKRLVEAYRREMALILKQLGNKSEMVNSSLNVYSEQYMNSVAVNKNEQANLDNKKADTTKKQIIDMGEAKLGILELALSTDYPDLAMATLIDRDMQGAILKGSFREGSNNSLYIEFNTLRQKDSKTTCSIQAIAVDAETTSRDVADDVERHMFTRLALASGAALLEGYKALSTAVGQAPSGTTVTTSTATVSENDGYSSEQKRDIVIGGGADILSGELKKELQAIKTTMRAYQNKKIAVLFTENVLCDVN